jgi:hypothetical protein
LEGSGRGLIEALPQLMSGETEENHDSRRRTSRSVPWTSDVRKALTAVETRLAIVWVMRNTVVWPAAYQTTRCHRRRQLHVNRHETDPQISLSEPALPTGLGRSYMPTDTRLEAFLFRTVTRISGRLCVGRIAEHTEHRSVVLE